MSAPIFTTEFLLSKIEEQQTKIQELENKIILLEFNKITQ